MLKSLRAQLDGESCFLEAAPLPLPNPWEPADRPASSRWTPRSDRASRHSSTATGTPHPQSSFFDVGGFVVGRRVGFGGRLVTFEKSVLGQRIGVTKFCIGAILTTKAIFIEGNYSCMDTTKF